MPSPGDLPTDADATTTHTTCLGADPSPRLLDTRLSSDMLNVADVANEDGSAGVAMHKELRGMGKQQ